MQNFFAKCKSFVRAVELHEYARLLFKKHMQDLDLCMIKAWSQTPGKNIAVLKI